jgi:hypothetical protein
MSKMNFSEIKAIANEYAELTFKTRGSYSAACGTFEIMLCHLVAELPKHKQAEFAAMMKANVEREIDRMLEKA